ncbi:MAG: LysM peptidoglycan-binding domain-containing protein [Myxococcota bacterium]
MKAGAPDRASRWGSRRGLHRGLPLALAWLLPAAVLHAEAGTIEHVVRRGETLWSIAAQGDIYADPYLWPVIYRFNRDQIQDPALIYPRQRLQIPLTIDDETRQAARREAGAPRP